MKVYVKKAIKIMNKKDTKIERDIRHEGIKIARLDTDKAQVNVVDFNPI